MSSEYTTILDAGVQTTIPDIAVHAQQLVYLDFDGADTAYHGELLTIDGIHVEDSGFDQVSISFIVKSLNAQFDDSVLFTAVRPESTDAYSTIYIGVTSAFDEYGSFLGLAETVDSGNLISDDNAFVFLDSTAATELVTSVIAHETKHLLGTLDHGGDGLARYAEVIDIMNGEVVNRRSVNSGTSMLIWSGGTANSTVINSAGALRVYNGGIVNQTIVSRYGDLYVSIGGIANNTIVNGFGEAGVYSGGVANDTIVNSYGDLLVFSGGTANHTTVNSWGEILVYNGGVANGIDLDDYAAMLYVRSGGTANSTTLDGNGYIYLSSGGTANNTTMNRGTMYVYSGGTANGLNLHSGASVYIDSGGTALNVVNSDYALSVDVIKGDSETVVKGTNADGTEFFVSNGRAYHVHGRLSVESGGTADYTAVEYYITIDGTANHTIANGGLVHLYNGVANDTILNSNGGLEVSGGTANHTIANMGDVCIYSGGTINDLVLNVGSLCVSNGGIMNFTTVNSGGTVHMYKGGMATDLIVNSGGELIVSRGAILEGDILLAGTATMSGTVSASMATITFGLNQRTPTDSYIVNNISPISDASFAIMVADDQKEGTYQLVGKASGFSDAVTVQGLNQEFYGMLSVGETISVDDKDYSLLNESSVLSIRVKSNLPDTTPPTITNISANTTLLTNSDVIVTADFGDDEELASQQYRIDSGGWNAYTSGVTMAQNGMV